MSEAELISQARNRPPERLPEFIGQLATANAIALSRLSAPAPAKVTALDKLLPTAEAAERLGVSIHYLRRHPEQLRHLERAIGRKVLYSSVAIEKFISQRR